MLGSISIIWFIRSNNKGNIFFALQLLHANYLFTLFLIHGNLQVWVATESGKLEVTYTHNEEHVSSMLVLDTWRLDFFFKKNL